MSRKSTNTPRRKLSLNADDIAREALALVDEEGMEAFSFRRLAKRLGCEAMSIYHYFASKQHLIDAMVTECLTGIDIPEKDLPPRDWMRQFCDNYRAGVLRHPGFALILTTHRLNHRPGLEILEKVVSHMAPGMPAARKAILFRVLSYFITGAVMDEALGYAKGPSAAKPVSPEDARRDFPQIMELGTFFGPEHHETYFDIGTEVLLDWFEAEMIEHATTTPLGDRG